MSDHPATTTTATKAAAPAARLLGLPRRLVILAGGLSLLVTLGGVGAWYYTQPAPLTDAERFTEALRLADAGELEAAHTVATELEAKKYVDAEFAGGVPYLQGLHQFQAATKAEPAAQPELYLAAAKALTEAQQQGLPDERKADVTLKLGTAQYLTGQLTSAAVQLKETSSTATGADQLRAAGMLADIYLQPNFRSPEMLGEARTLCEKLLSQAADPAARDSAILQQAELKLVEAQLPQALETLQQLSHEAGTGGAARILQARIELALQRPAAAREIVEEVLHDFPEDTLLVRQATWLQGLCCQQLSQGSAEPDSELLDVAARAYRKVIKLAPTSPEGVVSGIALGDLLRKQNGREQALQAYLESLKHVEADGNFQNRWMSSEEYRDRMLAAWNEWLQQQHFQETISLSNALSPLLPITESLALTARAQESWATAIDEELRKARYSVKLARRPEQAKHWADAGEAYAKLAAARGGDPSSTEALWTSSDHLRRAGELQRSLAQLEVFLRTRPSATLATALTRKAELLLDLDRREEARKLLQRVINDFGTDSVIFLTRYRLGECYHEQREDSLAIETWRTVLESSALTPAAMEWRMSLRAVGEVQRERAELLRRERERLANRKGKPAAAPVTTASTDATGTNAPAEETPKTPVELAAEARSAATEAVTRLREYVVRYPSAEDVLTVRMTLGEALMERAYWHQADLEQAETPAAGQAHQVALTEALEQALFQLEQSRDGWQLALSQDQLSGDEQRRLLSCQYLIPQTQFALGRFADAVVSYGAAANRDVQNPQVLMAYLQMARCYARMGRTIESRSMLEQAKVLLAQRQIPDSAFLAGTTTLSAKEWAKWLERASELGLDELVLQDSLTSSEKE